MPVAAAIGTTMPRFGIFISQNGVRVTQVLRPRRLVAPGVEDQQQRGRSGRLQQDPPRAIRDTTRVAAARCCEWQRSLPIGMLHRQLLGVGADRVDALAQRTYLILCWVGFLALFRDFSRIMLAFSIRHAGEEAAASILRAPR